MAKVISKLQLKRELRSLGIDVTKDNKVRKGDIKKALATIKK